MKDLSPAEAGVTPEQREHRKRVDQALAEHDGWTIDRLAKVKGQTVDVMYLVPLPCLVQFIYDHKQAERVEKQERRVDRQFAALMCTEAAHEPDAKVRAVKAREARRMQRDLSYARMRRARRVFQFAQSAPDGPVLVRSYDRLGLEPQMSEIADVHVAVGDPTGSRARPRERHAARSSKAGRGSPDGESPEGEADAAHLRGFLTHLIGFAWPEALIDSAYAFSLDIEGEVTS
jgi:hypothetical protein